MFGRKIPGSGTGSGTKGASSSLVMVLQKPPRSYRRRLPSTGLSWNLCWFAWLQQHGTSLETSRCFQSQHWKKRILFAFGVSSKDLFTYVLKFYYSLFFKYQQCFSYETRALDITSNPKQPNMLKQGFGTFILCASLPRHRSALSGMHVHAKVFASVSRRKQLIF